MSRTTQLWRTQSMNTTRPRPGVHRDSAFGGSKLLSVTARDFRGPGRDVILQQRRTREVNMLRSTARDLARTLRRDIKPDYRDKRWDSTTRSRLRGAAPGRASTPSASTPDLALTTRQALKKHVALRAAEKRHGKSNLILKKMFTAGTSANGAVSENGIAAAEQFYKHARPWQGQPSISYPSKTSACGTRFRK